MKNATKTHMLTYIFLGLIGVLFCISLIDNAHSSSSRPATVKQESNTDSEPTSKTNFNNCDEVVTYVSGLSYSTIVSKWGEGSIGEPWNANAGVGEIDVRVNITWNNVKCNGKSVVLTFHCPENFSKSPYGNSSVPCYEFQ